jgi:phage shock protein A
MDELVSSKAIEATRAVVEAQIEDAERELKKLRRDVVGFEGNAEEWRRNAALAVKAGDAELAQAAVAHALVWDARAVEARDAIARRQRVAAELRAALDATSRDAGEPRR